MAIKNDQKVDSEFIDLIPNKKRIINISLIIGIIIVCVLVFILSIKSEDKINKLSINDYFHEIDVNKYMELYTSNDKFIIYLASYDCEECVRYKKNINDKTYTTA